ncbi:MAG: hypothetical protein LBR25_02215 [Erysipelotrichaceae bacterium]|jgi:hypothetical protein|nr:hypothetical protein [Erysipelotrichaceae bacterium]
MKNKRFITLFSILALALSLLAGCGNEAKKILNEAIAKNNTVQAAQSKMVLQFQSSSGQLATLNGGSFVLESTSVKKEGSLLGESIMKVSANMFGQDLVVGNMYLKDEKIYLDMSASAMSSYTIQYYVELPEDFEELMQQSAAVSNGSLDLSAFLKNLKVSKDGSDTILTFQLNSNVLEKLFQAAAQTEDAEADAATTAAMTSMLKQIGITGNGRLVINSDGYIVAIDLQVAITNKQDNSQIMEFTFESTTTILADNYKLEFPDLSGYKSMEEYQQQALEQSQAVLTDTTFPQYIPQQKSVICLGEDEGVPLRLIMIGEKPVEEVRMQMIVSLEQLGISVSLYNSQKKTLEDLMAKEFNSKAVETSLINDDTQVLFTIVLDPEVMIDMVGGMTIDQLNSLSLDSFNQAMGDNFACTVVE